MLKYNEDPDGIPDPVGVFVIFSDPVRVFVIF